MKLFNIFLIYLFKALFHDSNLNMGMDLTNEGLCLLQASKIVNILP